MSKITDPYWQGSQGSNLELDLREEFHQTIYGSSTEVSKGKLGLLRVMRKDSDGHLIRCPCRNTITDEPDRDSYCRFCQGVGFFWDEAKIWYHKNDDSFRKREGMTQEYESDLFYLEYSYTVSSNDFIIEVALNDKGNLIKPIQRLKTYNIISADPFRSDNGRTEFWQIRAKFERKWSVWYNVKNRQFS